MINEVKDDTIIVMTYELLIMIFVVSIVLTIFTLFVDKTNFPLGLLATTITGVIMSIWRVIYKPFL